MPADWPGTKRYPVDRDWDEARSTLISMAPIQVTDRLPNPDAEGVLLANIELTHWWRDRESPAACIVGAWTELVDIIPSLQKLGTEIYGSQAKVKFFAFEFQPIAGHLDTVQAMLRHFIAQAVGCILPLTPPGEAPSYVLEIVDVLQEPNIDILYSLFQDVNVWIARLGLRAFWLVCGIDHTDDPDFMHRLVQGMSFSDAKPMFLFAGSDCQKLRSAVDGANVKLLEQPSMEIAPPSISLLEPPGLEGDLEYPDIRAMVDESLARIGDDETGRTIFLTWIRELISSTPINDWRSQISTVSTELSSKGIEGLFTAVLQSLPPYRRDCANDVLRLMLHSFRPLSPSNIMAAMSVEAALGAPVDVNTRNKFEDIPTIIFPLAKRWLVGLVQTKEAKLVFRDDRIRRAFIDTCMEDESPGQSHWRILHQLLRYLSTKISTLPEEESNTTPKEISPVSMARHTFIGYAVHYWARHYRAAIETEDRKGPADESVRDFLSNSEAVAFCLTASRKPRASEVTSSTKNPIAFRVALLARNGLSFTEITNLVETSEWNTEAAEFILPALRAAIQCGNARLVEEIPFTSLDEADLKAILLEAAYCEDIATLDILSQKSKGQLPLPQELLSQAARLGLVDVLREPLRDRRKDETIDYAEVFRPAVFCRQIKIIPLLNEFSDSLSPDNIFSLYEDACRVGEVGIVATLHRYLQKDQLADFAPLGTACQNGNSEVVTFILGKMNIAKGELLECESEGSDDADAIDCLRTSITLGWVRCTDAMLDYVDTVKDELRLRELLGDGIVARQYETCELLLRRTHLNLAEGFGEAPILTKAVRKNDLRLVQLLLDYGAEVDGTDEYEETPLYTAAYAGYTEIAELLLQANANVNARVANGGSIIYAACMKNKPETVKLLLSHSADIHLSTYNRNWSPLEAAFDYPEIVELLVKHRPPPDFKRLTVSRTNIKGKTTALFFAVSGNHVESVKWILQGDPDLEYRPGPNSGPLEGYTPLALAVQRGYTPIARMLLEKGANINHRILDERPLLHGATTEETLAVLLEYNVDTEATELGPKTTILSRLVVDSDTYTDYLPLITRLINAGANLDPIDIMGDTPLAIASWDGNMELIQLLIARGADVNGNSGKWGRPVHRAILKNNMDSLKALVEKGADLASCHSNLGTPLQVACGQDSETEIMEYLVEKKGADPNAEGATVRNVMLEACLRSEPKAILYLLNHGGLPSSRDCIGMPAIFAACFRSTDALPVIDELLKRGADISPNTRDKMGRTVLHCAVASGRVEVVKRVLEKEPTLLSEKDNDGWTALHWAARRAYPFFRREFKGSTSADDWAAVVGYLLEEKCSGINMTVSAAEKEWTVLSIARYHDAPSQVIDVVVKNMESSTAANPDECVEGKVNSEGLLWRCDGCYFVSLTGSCYLPSPIPLPIHRWAPILTFCDTAGDKRYNPHMYRRDLLRGMGPVFQMLSLPERDS
jgi:ankyrin repeat protein